MQAHSDQSNQSNQSDRSDQSDKSEQNLEQNPFQPRIYLGIRDLFSNVCRKGRKNSWSKVWKRLTKKIHPTGLTMMFEWEDSAKKFPVDLVKIIIDQEKKLSSDYIAFFQEIARIVGDNPFASFENLMMIAYEISKIYSLDQTMKENSVSDEIFDKMKAILPGCQWSICFGLIISTEVFSYIKLPLFEIVCYDNVSTFYHGESNGLGLFGKDGTELWAVIEHGFVSSRMHRTRALLDPNLSKSERERIQHMEHIWDEPLVWLPRSMKYYDDLRNLGVTGEDTDPNFGTDQWKRHRILLQLGLIIKNNPVGSSPRLMEIAFNVGQLKLTQTIHGDPFFTKKMRKYFKVNKMHSIKGYLDFSPDSKP